MVERFLPDAGKEWESRTMDLVREKEKLLANPRLFPEKMWRVLYDGRDGGRPCGDACLRETMTLVGGMTTEEVQYLLGQLTGIWNSEVSELEGSLDKTQYTVAINSLMAVQQAKRVNCLPAGPDDGDMLGQRMI